VTSQGPYLFLQGPSSPLFAKIAGHLTRAGHACYRINLNVGDQIFWRRGGAVNYRGRFENWGTFIRQFLSDHRIGTIILLGEERPYHKEAVNAAKEHGATVVVIEMGYLRPDWVTVELDGMSSNSRFPNDPDTILRAAADLPEPDWARRYRQTFFKEAVYDLCYYLPSVFLGFLYPRYRFHGIFHPLKEYLGWIGRLLGRQARARVASGLIGELSAKNVPWFVYPLQLETDYQLRVHSPYNSQREAITEIIKSFATFSEPQTKLIVKVHPLDNGLIAWRKIISGQASFEGVGHRVVYLDGGDLNQLFKGSQGIVTVNSTAALHGLKEGIPTKVLGAAIFDIKGLTSQQSLDYFWKMPSTPDPHISNSFFRLIAASIHVRGNFYSQNGSAAAASEIATRLIEGTVMSPGGDSGHHPRKRPEKNEKS